MNEELMLKVKGLVNLIGNSTYLAYTRDVLDLAREIQQDPIIQSLKFPPNWTTSKTVVTKHELKTGSGN